MRISKAKVIMKSLEKYFNTPCRSFTNRTVPGKLYILTRIVIRSLPKKIVPISFLRASKVWKQWAIDRFRSESERAIKMLLFHDGLKQANTIICNDHYSGMVYGEKFMTERIWF